MPRGSARRNNERVKARGKTICSVGPGAPGTGSGGLRKQAQWPEHLLRQHLPQKHRKLRPFHLFSKEETVFQDEEIASRALQDPE